MCAAVAHHHRRHTNQISNSPQLAAIRTAEEATLFKRNLEQVDYKKLHAVLRHSMVKHFTAPELEYLLNMYSQPLGRSVMAKMGAYTSEITPKLHEAMQPMMQANANFLVRALVPLRCCVVHAG